MKDRNREEDLEYFYDHSTDDMEEKYIEEFSEEFPEWDVHVFSGALEYCELLKECLTRGVTYDVLRPDIQERIRQREEFYENRGGLLL